MVKGVGEKGWGGKRHRERDESFRGKHVCEEPGVPGRLIPNDVNPRRVRSKITALGWRALPL